MSLSNNVTAELRKEVLALRDIIDRAHQLLTPEENATPNEQLLQRQQSDQPTQEPNYQQETREAQSPVYNGSSQDVNETIMIGSPEYRGPNEPLFLQEVHNEDNYDNVPMQISPAYSQVTETNDTEDLQGSYQVNKYGHPAQEARVQRIAQENQEEPYQLLTIDDSNAISTPPAPTDEATNCHGRPRRTYSNNNSTWSQSSDSLTTGAGNEATSAREYNAGRRSDGATNSGPDRSPKHRNLTPGSEVAERREELEPSTSHNTQQMQSLNKTIRELEKKLHRERTTAPFSACIKCKRRQRTVEMLPCSCSLFCLTCAALWYAHGENWDKETGRQGEATVQTVSSTLISGYTTQLKKEATSHYGTTNPTTTMTNVKRHN